ncbi:MAG: glycosyltransferase [Thermoleophilaceae bacterium]
MNVLVMHNRYRLAGGEERAVELQLAALERAGIAHSALVRDSAELGRLRAAGAMLCGGEAEREVTRAVRESGATVVHVHNLHPRFGPRALLAARAAGARVVMHLHNFRLFCAIAVCFRDGEPCFRCRGRLTLPGLALNCRGSLAESSVYAAALSMHQPKVLAAVDRFATLSSYAAGQLIRLGVPAERLSVVPNYVPAADIAERSRAGDGAYALVASRLAPEKGIETAVEASALSGVPLKVAGTGPLERELRQHAGARGAPVEFLGEVGRARVAALLDSAAMALVPSLGGDVMPFAALEAMAAGVPVIASRSGSLPELVGEGGCVPRADPQAMAERMRTLWDDRERRSADGGQLIERVRVRFAEQRYIADLLSLYADAGTHAHA